MAAPTGPAPPPCRPQTRRLPWGGTIAFSARARAGLFEKLAYSLRGDGFNYLQFNHLPSQHAHAPADMSFWWLAASQGDDMGLLLASDLGGSPTGGRSLRAISSPSATKRWRMRPTVAIPTSTIRAISLSPKLSLALSNIMARFSLRAGELPRRVISINCSRSSSVSSITYLIAAMTECPSHEHCTQSVPSLIMYQN